MDDSVNKKGGFRRKSIVRGARSPVVEKEKEKIGYKK